MANFLTTTFSNAGIVGGVAFIKAPTDLSRSRRVQVSVYGTGAVTATVKVWGSIDGKTYATLYPVILNGTGSDSSLNAVNVDGLDLKFTIEAISGTGAAVSVMVL